MKKNAVLLILVSILGLFTTLPMLSMGLVTALSAYGVAWLVWLGLLAPAWREDWVPLSFNTCNFLITLHCDWYINLKLNVMLEKLIEDIHVLCLSIYNEGLPERTKVHLRKRSVKELKSIKKILEDHQCAELIGDM